MSTIIWFTWPVIHFLWKQSVNITISWWRCFCCFTAFIMFSSAQSPTKTEVVLFFEEYQTERWFRFTIKSSWSPVEPFRGWKRCLRLGVLLKRPKRHMMCHVSFCCQTPATTWRSDLAEMSFFLSDCREIKNYIWQTGKSHNSAFKNNIFKMLIGIIAHVDLN